MAMSIVHYFFPYFLLYLSTILGFFLIGFTYLNLAFSGLFKTINNNFILTYALSCTAGLLIVVSCTAVFYTHFTSVFLWCFLFLLYPILKAKKISFRAVKTMLGSFCLSNILYLILLLFCIFIYHAYIFYNSSHAPFFDYLFYGKVSSGLLQEGIESVYVFNNDFHQVKYPVLYHYGELWMNGLINKLSRLPEVYTLVYVVYPVLHVLALVLCFAVISVNKRCKPIHYILGGFALLYGIKLFLPLEKTDLWALINTCRGFPLSPYSFKQLPIYILGILGILCYTTKNSRIAFIVFSFMPIFYASVIPAFAGIGVGLLLVSIINTKYQFKYWNIGLFEPLILLGVIAFILVYKTIFHFENEVNLARMFYPISTYIMLSVHTFLRTFTEHFIVFIFLIYFLFKLGVQFLIRPLILIPLFGLCAVNLFLLLHDTNIPDIGQTLTNISPFFMLMIAVDLFPFVNQKAWKLILPVLLLFGIFNVAFFKLFPKYTSGQEGRAYLHSEGFINNTNNYIARYKGKFKLCTITDYQTNTFKPKKYIPRWNYDSTNDFHFGLVNPNIRPPLEIGKLFDRNYHEFCLPDQSIKNLIIPKYPPCEWFKNKVVNNTNIVQFLKENKVSHLYIQNHHLLPKEFMQNCSLLFHDQLTGASLWKIK